MFKCKKCGGFVYEEEVFFEADNTKKIQLGCYSCPHKVYVEYQKWLSFKNRLEQAYAVSKNKKR